MTAQNKTTIKSYFETGDKPTQGQFGNMIDSYLGLAETVQQVVSGNVNFAGGISVSGNALGQAAYKNLATVIVDDGAGNLTIGSTQVTSTMLAVTPVSAGSYTAPQITVNTKGQITSASPASVGGMLTGTLPNPTLSMSPITNSLGADVNLNNASNYFDGPSIAQGSTGTWFVSGTVTVTDTATSNAAFFVKLWDGTTVIASAVMVQNPSNTDASISLSGFIVSPTGNLRISVRDGSSTNGKIIFNASALGKDSTITAIRIG